MSAPEANEEKHTVASAVTSRAAARLVWTYRR